VTAAQLRKVHLVLAIIWAGPLTLATILWWHNSILWVGLMSSYAIVISHLAVYAGARAEES
jgi:hypothetical protein